MVQGNWADFHARALERVSTVPGVQQAAFAWGVPLTGNNWPGSVEIEGRPVASPSDRVPLPLRSVTPGYFSLLGLTVTEGRDFRSSDVPNAPPVAIVNQSFADRYFAPGDRDRQEALVRRTRAAADGNHRRRQQRPHRRSDPHGRCPRSIFRSGRRSAFSKDLVVRAAGDPRSVTPPCSASCGAWIQRSRSKTSGPWIRFAPIRWPRAASPCSCWWGFRWSAAC